MSISSVLNKETSKTMKNNNRLLAWEITHAVVFKGKYSNLLLQDLKNMNAVSENDMAFITKLVYTTIQYKIYLEYVVNKLIDDVQTDEKIKTLLWMATCEFYFLEKPIYAVTNEYVELAKSMSEKLAGLVNKVLKNLFNDKKLFNVDIKNKKNVLPLKNGMAFWMYQKFVNDYGAKVADQIIENVNCEKSKSFRINTIKMSEKQFYETFNMDYDFKPSKIAKSCFTTKLNLINTPIFQEGLIYAQDQCSVLTGQIANPQPNSKVLDMCSAPGGKLTHLAALMQNTGELYGNEINPAKLKLINGNLIRLGVTNCQISNLDALLIKENNFDTILLDAPCSGLGVMKSKPEIRIKKPAEILGPELVAIQSKLLDKADDLLKKGGHLIYSTCTINKDENANQIREFLTRHKDYQILEEHQFFGYEYQTDGFYICKLQKNN
jgi:16S rRNA (cytosine967-C5)-methyltransferase